MKKKLLIFILLLAVFIPKVWSISADSTTQISLLTVYPRSTAVYTVFGHTAIRVWIPSQNVDAVFNYGTFDSNRPNFIFHFLKGETDYMLGVDDFMHFKYIYGSENATVMEQVLDISLSEKQQILKMFENNLRPENREYRYNYFFDNCSTRPRDIIEKYAGGKITYHEQHESLTFRTLVHQCLENYPWMNFGVDMLLGSGSDSLISLREEMFLPERLMLGLETATVLTPGSKERPLVDFSQVIMESEITIEDTNGSSLLSPMSVGVILLILCLVSGLYSILRKNSRIKIFFSFVFFGAAIAGCIVSFIAFGSTHPCTWPNFNLIWLHPLHFIAVVGFLLKKTYPVLLWFHWTNFVLLSLLLLLWAIIPQQMNTAFIPFIICLWVGSGSQLLFKKNN